jgi:hypothetical protein
MLALDLAILSEEKSAKIIRLLEEFPRDSPEIHDRVDHEAEAMAQPANPQSMLQAIRETGGRSVAGRTAGAFTPGQYEVDTPSNLLELTALAREGTYQMKQVAGARQIPASSTGASLACSLELAPRIEAPVVPRVGLDLRALNEACQQ